MIYHQSKKKREKISPKKEKPKKAEKRKKGKLCGCAIFAFRMPIQSI